MNELHSLQTVSVFFKKKICKLMHAGLQMAQLRY